MSDGHTHGIGGGELSASRERRLRLAIGLNVLIVVFQIAYGLAADSLGLLSDAGHNLTDVAALALSLGAVRLARRPATESLSFGWHRVTVLAAQANATMILLLTVWIVYESIGRIIDPVPVEGGIVLIVALVAFVANTIAALIVRERPEDGHEDDLNMKSALLHLVSDAAASLGVAAAGAVMLATGGWHWLDPAASLAIALLIAWHGWKILKSSYGVLFEATPRNVRPQEIIAEIESIERVGGTHDLHVWAISHEVLALSVHVLVSGQPTLEEASIVGAEVRRRLSTRFNVAHATIELESEACVDRGPGCSFASAEPTVLTAAADSHRH